MRLIDIELKRGARYRDSHGRVWIYDSGLISVKTGKEIESVYTLDELSNMEFSEDVDWSKIPVDTKVMVYSNDGEWHRKYFAKYERGEIYTFALNADSWSALPGKFEKWKDVILAESEENI